MKPFSERETRGRLARFISDPTGRIETVGCVFLFALIVILLTSNSARAGDGDLDPTFGNGGKVITDFSQQSDIAQGIAIQPDGKIVVVGDSGVDLLRHSALARYNPDGSLDTTFGSGGRVLITLDAGGDLLDSVAIQPDGKIVVGGALNQNNANLAFLVARFNSNGTLDTSFGNGGRMVTTFGDASAQVNSLVLQPDGKILVAGQSGFGSYSELNDFALARYKTDGSLDPTFGNGGKLKTHFPGETNTGSRATEVLLAPDGKIFATGSYKTEVIQRQFAAARYMSNGDLDPTFGNGGLVTTLLGAFHSFGMTAVLQPDGKLVIGGFKDARRNNDFALARYNTNGSLDTTFGNGGIIINDLFGSSDDIVYSLLLMPDGKLIATGMTGDYPNFRFGLARYQSNGTFDASFGSGGKVITDFGGVSSRSFGSALQTNGKIVLAGYTVAATAPDFTNNFAVARYNAGTRAKPFDFDADGRTDISIFRPGPREWWINRSLSNTTFAAQFGATNDAIVPADYTGDNKTDIAVWRPSTGEWYVLRSEDFSFYAYPFGTGGDLPIAADFDADGRADSAIFRPTTGVWYVLSSGGGVTVTQFGTYGDMPAVGDYDNDNRADIALYRPLSGQWWISRSSGGVISVTFGTNSDRPVVGDYTGDNKADLAFYRPSTSEWFILRSEDGSFFYAQFGTAGDIPAPGDYDGDGRFDITVFRPSSGTWYSQRTTAGTLVQQFGITGDRPVPNAFLY